MILDMAMGGSTNTVLHTLAVAHEAQIEYSLERIHQLSVRTPNICRVAPSSHYHIEDVHNCGRYRDDSGEYPSRPTGPAAPVLSDRDGADVG